MNVINKSKTDRILASGKVKLNLGSGHHNYPDYINIDLNPEVSTDIDIQHDITDLSIFPDDSIDEVVCYHVIEHLGHRKVPEFFREIFRVLKTGGKFTFETPNLAAALEQFCKKRANSGEIQGDIGDNSIYHTIYGGQQDAGSVHLGCFTRWQLMVMLKWAGFEETKIVPELPLRGVEYGPDWNIRLVCIKEKIS